MRLGKHVNTHSLRLSAEKGIQARMCPARIGYPTRICPVMGIVQTGLSVIPQAELRKITEQLNDETR